MDPTLRTQTIHLRMMSTTSEYDTGEVITAGDFDAYLLEIEFMDITSIVGLCNLHFVRGDGETTDVFGEIDGNVVRYTLNSGLYAMPGLQLWVQFIDSNLHTPLLILFSGIRVYPEGPAIEDLDPYPEWTALILQVQAMINTLNTVAANTQAIADDVQGRLERGEFIGPIGPMPTHEWNGYEIRFQTSSATWGSWTNIRGATGKTAFEYAVEYGWLGSEALFGTHLANVDKLMYDSVLGEWVSGAVVTQSQYEDMVTNETLDPNTLYFVKLPEGV